MPVYLYCVFWCILFLTLLCFDSRPRTKQKYGSHENEGLSGMLKLCTAVMRHDPSFKMSPDGLVSDVFLNLFHVQYQTRKTVFHQLSKH